MGSILWFLEGFIWRISVELWRVSLGTILGNWGLIGQNVVKFQRVLSGRILGILHGIIDRILGVLEGFIGENVVEFQGVLLGEYWVRFSLLAIMKVHPYIFRTDCAVIIRCGATDFYFYETVTAVWTNLLISQNSTFRAFHAWKAWPFSLLNISILLCVFFSFYGCNFLQGCRLCPTCGIFLSFNFQSIFSSHFASFQKFFTNDFNFRENSWKKFMWLL